MYQRKNKIFQRERVFKAIFVIVVVFTGGIISYLLAFFGSWKDEFDLFFNGFDVESSLIPDEYINDSFIDERAMQFEQLLGTYHIPFNMTGEGWDYYPPVSVCWSWSDPNWKYYNNTELLEGPYKFDPLNVSEPQNNKSLMTYCGDKGHTALYEGVYCAGEAFRYAVAKRNNDNGNITASEERIWKMVQAYELLSNVSDRSYFVRYAVPNTTLAYEKFPGHWETEDHYVVEYKGFKWSLSRHLSRDVTIGIMFALSMVYYFVDNATIREHAGYIIDKTVQYMYDCNWRIIDTDGTTDTSGDFQSSRPLLEGDSILTFLQMAKMVNPNKWGPIYAHFAYDKGFAYTLGRSIRIGLDLSTKIFTGYYGCNFLYNNAPTLIFLERDPLLRELYIKNWLNVMHDFTKLHRNANFDVVWLLCHTNIQEDKYAIPTITLKDYDMEIWKKANIQNPTDKAYIENFCVRDIRDCLMRYAVRRYPNRNYWWATAPGTFPNVHQQPIQLGAYTVEYPEYDYWIPTPIVSLINDTMSIIGEGFSNSGIFNNSLPVDMRKTEDIMWQRESFSLESTERLDNSPGNFQVPAGPEFLSVYWISKYLDIF